MKHPPYHLRTNKSVDRLMLARLLHQLDGKCENYRYFSLSGPFLEDLRIMDQLLPDMKLISIEKNLQTHKRQEFHRFNSVLEIKNKTFSDFLIHDYEPEDGKIDVFWLDYTDLSLKNLTEFQQVLKKVPPGSVVRITLRAQREFEIEELEEFLPKKVINEIKIGFESKFQEEFDAKLPSEAEGAFAGNKEFANMVQGMVRNAASEALDSGGRKVDFLPVQTTRYSDNTQMLSVTGIVCYRNEMDNLKEKLKSISCVNFEWNEPTEINIPALSIKERLLLENRLPVESGKDVGEELSSCLGYMIDNSEKQSRKQLEHYAEYCRFYPNFIRINL